MENFGIRGSKPSSFRIFSMLSCHVSQNNNVRQVCYTKYLQSLCILLLLLPRITHLLLNEDSRENLVKILVRDTIVQGSFQKLVKPVLQDE